ncbi:Nif3-like dinuclear metal center hexameric protein [Micromonospora sp. WMMD1128]|uniref:Nif3-like dinuclear metal center hexameric protein n=1 Tax=Micromonospora sp. WMMD1128 TaxID=3015150 RepID=UPI00248CA9EA|nr:Nif3-like dinuclear metal center hexameric protein [Micromonospora sp. WMMD1128]WBB75795.1 Nif3-like dinuclear metal center hexameric protein [Micromonospora sp. WMMD1128]
MSGPATVHDAVDLLDRRHPTDLADPADRVGLLAGRPDSPLRRVLLAVDAVAATVHEARAEGADLLVTHRPPTPDTVAHAEAAGLALYTAHSNAAVARPGVSDALAAVLGLGPTEPLVPVPRRRDVLVVFVPLSGVERLIDAAAAAGAGVIGDYRRCAWWTAGTGTFVPAVGARPAAGTVGQVSLAPEARVEMTLPRSRRAEVLAAARDAHPYEEPACYLFELAELPDGHGHGRVGELPRAMSAGELAGRWGGAVRVAGDARRPLRTVAVCAGAGGRFVEAATACGVDAYLAGDLAAAAGPPVLLDAGGWATVRPWLGALARTIAAEFRGRLPVRVSARDTDRWSLLGPRPETGDPVHADGPAWPDGVRPSGERSC